jgi:uncharacterized protein
MNRRRLLRTSLLLLPLAAGLGQAKAQSARQIAWDDLLPKGGPVENPFTKLAPEHLEALIEVAAVRDRKAMGVELTPIDVAAERDALAKLKAAKIDADDLLARRKEIAMKLRAQSRATNAALDNQLIRMPGYLLPLEFSGQQVTEFLLVPYVGACIHSPPPPPNQIVYVKSDKPVEVKTTFDAVWVTGRMSTTAASKALHLVDGTSNIDVGYALAAARVEPYKQ